MYDLSSRVSGSMIWYSSSMPSVRDGAFMSSLAESYRGSDHEGRHGRAAAGGDVEQRRGREARQAAVHVTRRGRRTGRCRACGRRISTRPSTSSGTAPSGARCAPARCTARSSAVRDRRLPGRVVDLPAEHDALAAVVVVRLEHELLAVRSDERQQVDLGSPSKTVRRSSTTRVHGMCAAIAARSSALNSAGVALVAQHREARLLVQHLAAERVHHAHRAVPHGPHHRVVHPARARPARRSAPACRSG